MSIDLRHFRCFVAVAEELHFHRAAKKLGVAQPALSRTIKNLESELGVTLLERNNRRVELSEVGRLFLDGCRDILARTHSTVQDVQRAHQGMIGTLRISYTDNAMNGRAPALIKGFQDAKPDISMVLTHSVTSDQLKQLDDDAIDFGFATGGVTRDDLNHIRIQSEGFVCVVYDTHPLATRKGVKLAELADEPMVQGSKAHWAHFYSYLDPLFRRAGFAPKIAQEGLTTNDIQRLVACGVGIAVLTETVVETLPPGLKVIPITDIRARLDTIVVWKPGRKGGTKDSFVKFLRAALA